MDIIASPPTADDESKASVSSFYVGIFNDERVICFLQMLQQLSTITLQQLADMSKKVVSAGRSWEDNFRIGLLSISTWSSSVQDEEARNAISLYPDITTLYRYTVILYVKQTNGQIEDVTIDVAPFRIFLHCFYTNLSEMAEVQNLKFVTHRLSHFEKLDVLMNAIRTALYTITSGRVIPRVSDQLQPWDSISNVGWGGEGGSQISAAPVAPMSGLTQKALNSHSEGNNNLTEAPELCQSHNDTTFASLTALSALTALSPLSPLSTFTAFTAFTVPNQNESDRCKGR